MYFNLHSTFSKSLVSVYFRGWMSVGSYWLIISKLGLRIVDNPYLKGIKIPLLGILVYTLLTSAVVAKAR